MSSLSNLSEAAQHESSQSGESLGYETLTEGWAASHRGRVAARRVAPELGAVSREGQRPGRCFRDDLVPSPWRPATPRSYGPRLGGAPCRTRTGSLRWSSPPCCGPLRTVRTLCVNGRCPTGARTASSSCTVWAREPRA